MKKVIYLLILLLLTYNFYGCTSKVNKDSENNKTNNTNKISKSDKIKRTDKVKKQLLISMNQNQDKARQSKQNLDRYKSDIDKEIVKLNKELESNEEIFVTITFSKPLSSNQVSDLIDKYELKPNMVIYRGIEKGSGLRTTGASGVNSSKDVNNLYKPSDFIGFIELVADVKNRNILTLSKDKNVYLIDPFADNYYIFHREKDYRPGMYWQLEDYKLVKY